MDLWRAILLGSAPGFLFLWMFWKRDRFEREPKALEWLDHFVRRT